MDCITSKDIEGMIKKSKNFDGVFGRTNQRKLTF
jgi:hypothetical protein